MYESTKQMNDVQSTISRLQCKELNTINEQKDYAQEGRMDKVKELGEHINNLQARIQNLTNLWWELEEVEARKAGVIA